MGHWLGKLFSWRDRRGVKTPQSTNRRKRQNLAIDHLEDRLAPAIGSLPPLGEGLNMPRFPIEAAVRSATGKDWSDLTITIATPTANQSFNHNVTVTGSVVPAGLDQVTLQAKTDSGSFVPVTVTNSQYSFTTALGLGGGADGSHTVTLFAKDQAGRTATKTVTFGLDTKAPTITSFDLDSTSDTTPTGDHTTTLSTVTFKGKTEAGVTVTLTNTNASTTADSSGNFTFSNVALTNGTATFTVKATDAAGNVSTFSQAITRNQIPLDVTVDALTTKDTTPTITGTVSDSAATVKISINGGTPIDAQVTGGTWSVTLTTALAEGTFTVTATATTTNPVASDTGTGNLVIDLTSPSVTVISNPASPTNATKTTITVTFSEAMSNFVVGDIAVGGVGGTLSNFVASSDNKVFTADLTPTADGAVTVTINAGVAQDTAGNNNLASTPITVTFDRTAPTVTISSTATEPTANSPIPFHFTFGESVADFASADLSAAGVITGGTLTSFSGAGTSYDITVTPTGPGPVTINLPAGVAHDAAGNSNPATSFTRTFDNVAPTATIAFNATSPTSNTGIEATITFSENVQGFTAAGISVNNGATLGALSTVDAKTYKITITPTANGPITLSIAANTAHDAANNQVAATSSAPIVFDNVVPTVTITTTATDPTNLATIPFTVQFSEDVLSFTVAGLNVTNGTVSNFQKVSDQEYTFDVDPTVDGTVIVEVLSGSASDAAGNQNTGASKSIVADIPPVVSFAPITSPTASTSVTVTITFSEAVTGFTETDINVTNGATSNFVQQNPTTYTVDIAPTADGLVTIEVVAGAAQDSSNLPNASKSTTFTFDSTPPIATIVPPSSDPTNQSPILMTVNFDEDVTNFTEAGLDVTNGAVSGFTMVNPKQYTFNVTPAADGQVTVKVLADAAQDAAGNKNALATISFESDRTVPTATLTTTAADPTNNPVVPITVVFSENVGDFDIGDLFITNGSPSNFVQQDPKTYTFDVTATADGLVVVQIQPALVHDAAGNAFAGTSFTATTVLTAQPTATITGVTDPTNQATHTITVTFDEDVFNFVDTDIQLTNATMTANSFTQVDQHTYTFEINATAEGQVTIEVLANSAEDAAGNLNQGKTLTYTYDATGPTATITGVTDPTNQATHTITVTFDEDVVNFTETDIQLTNATMTAASFTQVDPKTYTFEITATAEGSVTIDVPASGAQDAAGNANQAKTLTYTYDATGPTPTITGVTDPTNQATHTITVTFDEDVVNFTETDIQLTNATMTAASFTQVDPKTYTFEITATAEGSVTIDVPASGAQDAAGNANQAKTLTFTYDTTGPTPTVTANDTDPTNNATIPFTVTFDEDVADFVLADVQVTNGAAGNFVQVNPKTYNFDVVADAPGLVTVTVPAGVAHDTAGNDSVAGTGSITFSG